MFLMSFGILLSINIDFYGFWQTCSEQKMKPTLKHPEFSICLQGLLSLLTSTKTAELTLQKTGCTKNILQK